MVWQILATIPFSFSLLLFMLWSVQQTHYALTLCIFDIIIYSFLLVTVYQLLEFPLHWDNLIFCCYLYLRVKFYSVAYLTLIKLFPIFKGPLASFMRQRPWPLPVHIFRYICSHVHVVYNFLYNIIRIFSLFLSFEDLYLRENLNLDPLPVLSK